MKLKLLTTLALAAPLLATTSPAALAASDEAPAKAEASKDAMQSKDSAKDTDEAKNMDSSMNEGDADKSEMAASSNIDYVTSQKQSEWSAQALIGRDVLNTDGEELGEINNVVINESGNVVAVTIGVGGFLGLGEKDVGVPFDALKFETASGEAVDKDRTAENEDTRESDQETLADQFEREHPDTKVVLDATRDQLKDAPEFLWLDEQDDKRAAVDDMTTAR